MELQDTKKNRAVGFFKNIILTNKGKELLLSSNNNIDNSLEFNICKFGDGRYLENEIAEAKDVKNPWLTQNINTVRIDNSSPVPKLIIEITFSNKDMTEPKIMSELGIFAKDKSGTIHLFAYCLSNTEIGEDIEIENDYPTTFKISIISVIDNNTNVTNIIDPDGFLTKEVIELLKENIRNIAFRKIQGTLTANQKVIQVPTDILLPISQRAVLNIEGEVYFLGRDYTIDIHANTITLNDRYSFKDGTQYEIIDPLPATYVKEQIQEFIDDFKKLVSDSKIDFDKLKDKIYLDFQEKVDSFYLQLDEFIEQNKENLKGHSIDRIVENGKDENGGNIYNIFRDDDKKIGTMVAPRGLRGNGIINPEYVGKTENGDTEYVLVLEDGTKTTEKIISPKGQNGTPFYFAKTYSSITDMEADFETDNVNFGEYVVISSNDNDNAKLFEKRTEGFVFIVQIAMRGADFVTLEFVRFDDEGNTIARSKNSKGEYGNEIPIKRGERGYTGGTVGEPQPPEGVQYGTIVEGIWAEVPSGWLYTNGGILDKKRYPHMSFLPGTTQPQEPYFKIDGGTQLTSKGTINNQPTWEFNLGELKGKLYQDFLNESRAGLYFNSFLSRAGYCYSASTGVYYGMTNAYYYIELPEKLALSYISMNKTNATGNSTTTSGVTNKSVDVYFDIEYMDDNGDWIKGAELHNKTDFIPPSESSQNSIAMIKSSFKSNKFRIIINNKSLQNYVSSANIYYIGEVVFGFDKGGTQYNDYIQLPNEKDNQGRYKLIYVGQPLEITEPTIYSYDSGNKHNGEVPLSLAVENKIPNYSNGITMSEPNILKLGYANKYNSKSDSWELVKTHEDKEGYYYDSLGDLKHNPKPYNWVKWDFINNNWIEDTVLKENAKKELLDKYIDLEIKKDKMIGLEIDTTFIVEEIEKIKKDLEEIK